MADIKFGAAYYRRRAAQMRELAERSGMELFRSAYLRLADNWLERADKEDQAMVECGK